MSTNQDDSNTPTETAIEAAPQTDSTAQPSQNLVTQASFSGPLPPPSILEGYDHIVPGAADRIIKMAESEVSHRQECERRALNAEIRDTTLGQIFAFLIAIFTIGSGAYAATHGAPFAGGSIGTAGVVGLVSVFIYGRRRKGED